MLQTASKTRPALVSARSSFHAGSGTVSRKAASTYAASDIFDTPGRLIFEDESPFDTSRNPSLRYHPSHFRPLGSQPNVQASSSSSSPIPSTTHKHQLSQQSQTNGLSGQAHARQLSTLAHHRTTGDVSTIVFDGPARPRNPPRVTSRHGSARASSSAASSTAALPLNAFEGVDMKKYVPPMPPQEPMVFDGPARPRRKAPVQTKKASQAST